TTLYSIMDDLIVSSGANNNLPANRADPAISYGAMGKDVVINTGARKIVQIAFGVGVLYGDSGHRIMMGRSEERNPVDKPGLLFSIAIEKEIFNDRERYALQGQHRAQGELQALPIVGHEYLTTGAGSLQNDTRRYVQLGANAIGAHGQKDDPAGGRLA